MKTERVEYQDPDSCVSKMMAASVDWQVITSRA